MPMLYRSPITRWVLTLVAVTAGLIFALGDEQKWRSTSSLRWLAQAPIPLQAWGVAMVLYGLLLLTLRTRPLGYAVGAVLWAVFTVSLLATLSQAGPKNIVAVAAFLDTAAFHAFSIRTAWAQRLEA